MPTNPFNPNEFFHNLLRQFYVYSHEITEKSIRGNAAGYDVLKELEKMEWSHIIDQVSACVNERRYLIVIDGISTIVEWDWIKTYFPDKKNGSRIIVSTQHVEIATLCTEQPYQVTELKQLSSEHAIYLFHKAKAMPASDLTGPSSNPNVSTTNGKNSAISNGEMQKEEQIPKDIGGNNVCTSSSGKKFEHSQTIALVDDEPIGRKTDKSKVIDLISQTNGEEGCKVISVWGMGGLGKTTLARSVYRSQQLGGWKRAWVTALHPFNREVILRSIALQLQKDIQDDPAVASGTRHERKAMTTILPQELTQELTRLLEMQKCLIVVDDLSSIQEWDSIKENFEEARCILVTTREKNVADYCSREEKNIYGLKGLKEDAALNLFKQKVFKENTENDDLCHDVDMMEQARLILKKCDGLPLAICTIGGFLATKPKMATEWRKMNDCISAALEIDPGLKTIKTVLMRSYDGLPYHLKSSFLYMSLFPEGHKIRRKLMVMRWIAEGYSRDVRGMIAEEVGDSYFHELFNRGMTLPAEGVVSYGGKIDYCQLHDMIREICISKAREENLVFTLEQGCSLRSTQGAIRHLTISSNWERDRDVFQKILDLSHVRSLTVFGEWRSFFISSKMRFLRVLDLEDTSELRNHHLNQIGELLHLKYLSIRRCFYISQLPNCLGNLRHLQTLDATCTDISKLPSTVTKVLKLQRLHVSYSSDQDQEYQHSKHDHPLVISKSYGDDLLPCPREGGVILPRGTVKLKALHTLDDVKIAGGEANSTPKELKQLIQLRRLGVVGVDETNRAEFWSAIAGFNHLICLSVNRNIPGSRLDASFDGSFSPPKSLESLKLKGGLVRVTEWIQHLQNLTKLLLSDSKVNQDAIQAIGKLPNLAIIRMGKSAFLGKELQFKRLSFPNLILLELHGLGTVTSVKFEDGTMLKLELLQATGWRELQEFSGLPFLTKLKEVWLGDKFREEIVENVQSQLADQGNQVSLKLMNTQL
uniref:NB-ARC domain-containing protein n=1 Tax=Arundo donax TaxID=35708 RepID=A0A0A8Z170_ARUDO